MIFPNSNQRKIFISYTILLQILLVSELEKTHLPSQITLTRFSATIGRVWNYLVDDVHSIKIRKKHHEIRGGLTQEPITADDLRIICPLHALIRGELIVQKLIYHLRLKKVVWENSLDKF